MKGFCWVGWWNFFSVQNHFQNQPHQYPASESTCEAVVVVRKEDNVYSDIVEFGLYFKVQSPTELGPDRGRTGATLMRHQLNKNDKPAGTNLQNKLHSFFV